MVQAELAGQAEFRTRFAREAAAAQKVSGRSPRPWSTLTSTPPVPWLATAYVPGLLRSPTRSPGMARCPLYPCRRWRRDWPGPGAIHEAIVHRDLKPPNVLLAEDGPRIIDFAEASPGQQRRSMLTGTGVVLSASPGFMSPEQARGHRVRPAFQRRVQPGRGAHLRRRQGPFGTGSGDMVLYRVVFTPPDTSGVPAP